MALKGSGRLGQQRGVCLRELRQSEGLPGTDAPASPGRASGGG